MIGLCHDYRADHAIGTGDDWCGMFIRSMARPSLGVVVSATAFAGGGLRSPPNMVTGFGIINYSDLTFLGCLVSYSHSDQPMGQ